MKALVKSKAEQGIWLVDVPEPEYGIDDVLIKVMKTGICGTDVHIYNWDSWAQKTIKVPTVAGHEFVGKIVAVGSNVSGLKEGDLVSAEGHIVCGRCRNCLAGRRHLCAHTLGVGVNRNGAFAEYVAVPAVNVWSCTDGIPLEYFAIFDPLGNAAHTALSFDLVGEDVLITGAGPIGIMAVAMARRAGARHVVITDINDYRLDLARSMGASAAVNVAKEDIRTVMRGLGMQEGFDVGLEMSGNPAALTMMIETMAHGGKIAMLGIQPDKTGIDWDAVVFKGLTLKGIYGRQMFETWYKLTAMIQSGMEIGPVITHRFPYTDFQQGFDVMRSGKSGKVVLDWDL
ncbi:MAG: L-threonine 3-dehydrogenase [Alphaproteobacteria bacterium]|nr:L-threonine 3-dehydrogenase [Alphaproteobacteria bacterium]